jgi:hypothetical protein
MMFDVNYVAVLVAALAGFFIGWAWYSPMLFMKPWMQALGLPMDPNMKPTLSGMAPSMVVALVQQLVTAYILVHIAIAFGAVDWMGAVQLAFWVWLGFIATTMLSPVLWEKRSWTWYGIVTSQLLVSYVVMVLILVLWH